MGIVLSSEFWRRAKFEAFACCVLVMTLLSAIGCGGSRISGTYTGDARLIPGAQETGEPGYTLEELRAKSSERSITLNRDGRYVWNAGGGSNEGTWREDGESLILRDDTVNGIEVLPPLRVDRVWRIDLDGTLVDQGRYSAYNIEAVYYRE